MDFNPLSKGLSFMKMHGAGNDFVVIDSRGHTPLMTTDLARAIGDRHCGVGFDQLVEIHSPTDTGSSLDFWNSDGSKSGACGNGTRCVAGILMDEAGTDSVVLQTQRGLLPARRDSTGLISVNMGQPQLNWQSIPLAKECDAEHLPLDGDPAAVNMGNPHCVFFVDDVSKTDIATLGPVFEHDPLFPERANIEFVQIKGRSDIRMRVWERGGMITLACGSGACASVVAAHHRGLTDRQVSVHADGGTLTVDWRDDGVWLSGPTVHVFSSTLPPAFLKNL